MTSIDPLMDKLDSCLLEYISELCFFTEVRNLSECNKFLRQTFKRYLLGNPSATNNHSKLSKYILCRKMCRYCNAIFIRSADLKIHLKNNRKHKVPSIDMKYMLKSPINDYIIRLSCHRDSYCINSICNCISKKQFFDIDQLPSVIVTPYGFLKISNSYRIVRLSTQTNIFSSYCITFRKKNSHEFVFIDILYFRDHYWLYLTSFYNNYQGLLPIEKFIYSSNKSLSKNRVVFFVQIFNIFVVILVSLLTLYDALGQIGIE